MINIDAAEIAIQKKGGTELLEYSAELTLLRRLLREEYINELEYNQILQRVVKRYMTSKVKHSKLKSSTR